MCIPVLNEFDKHKNIVKSMKMQPFFEKIDWNELLFAAASECCDNAL